MRKDERKPSDIVAPGSGAEEAAASWVSAFDTPLLAGNLAHELTNALFALHLHLDGAVAGRGRQARGTHARRGNGREASGSHQAVQTVLSRLDELSRGLRLVARVPGVEALPNGLQRPQARTSLSEWWSLARVAVLVSVPKGIDVDADIPHELPPAVAGPAELTACAVLISRRVVGPGRIEPPCTLRLIARPEGSWIRLTALAHGVSRAFEPVSAPAAAGDGGRFMLEKPDPLAASVLVARAAARGAVRHAIVPGNVP